MTKPHTLYSSARAEYSSGVPRGIPALPDDFRRLLELIEAAKLFAVQEWIATGKSLSFKEVPGSRRQLIEKSIETGFHSMVEVLLQAGGWTSDDLTGALEFARETSLRNCCIARAVWRPGKRNRFHHGLREARLCVRGTSSPRRVQSK